MENPISRRHRFPTAALLGPTALVGCSSLLASCSGGSNSGIEGVVRPQSSIKDDGVKISAVTKSLISAHSQKYYLTIDDAPAPDTDQVLDFLKAHNIKVLFFCRGDQMDIRPDIMVRAIKEGHIICNHTYTHPRLSNLSLNDIKIEILKTETAIEKAYKAAGVKRPGKFFRAPHLDDAQNHQPDFDNWLKKLGFTHYNLPGTRPQYSTDLSQAPVQERDDFDTCDWDIADPTVFPVSAWRKQYGPITDYGVAITTKDSLVQHNKFASQILGTNEIGVMLTHSQISDDYPNVGNAKVWLYEMNGMLKNGIKFVNPPPLTSPTPTATPRL